MSNTELFAGGPLAFPITPFASNGELDLDTFTAHLERLMRYEPPALFIACGTGELAALDQTEVRQLVAAAVEVAAGAAPVFAGAGQGYKVALGMLRVAEEAGAAGCLVLPPYLVTGEQAGLYDYFGALAEATDLPLILYQRDNVRFEPETVKRLAELPSVVGFKDGLGDIELFQRTVCIVGDALAYFNGMPTAETFQSAYAGMGVHYYSSAVFNFVPEVSWAFYRAINGGDRAQVDRLLAEFFVPLAELRGRVKGYAVSLVKTGVELRWGPVGPVRPPLVATRREHVAALESIVKRVGYLVE